MPDRAVIPLAIATMFGFLLGLMASVLQLIGGAALIVALLGCVAATLAAVGSVLGCEGDPASRRSVAFLRALFGCLLFLGIFLGMQSYLRDGRVILAIVYLAAAGVAAGMLVQPRLSAREPGDRQQTA
jgi:hypothetical protein